MGGCRFPEKKMVTKGSLQITKPLGSATWWCHLAWWCQWSPSAHWWACRRSGRWIPSRPRCPRAWTGPPGRAASSLCRTPPEQDLHFLQPLRLWPLTFHTSPVSPSPSSPKAETSCWLVSGDEKWWLCRFLEHKLIATFSAQFEAIQKETIFRSWRDQRRILLKRQGDDYKSNLLVVRCSNRILWPQATGSPLLHRSSYSGPWVWFHNFENGQFGSSCTRNGSDL